VRGIGLGAESFSKVYPEYMIIQTPAPHAHSTYLEMLIEIGLFGFLAMAWLLLVWTFDVLRAVFGQKGAGGARWAEIGILSGVVGAISGHLLQGMIEYTWYSPRVTIAFWALMGIGAGIAASRQRGSLKDGVQAR
jgi:O-antigen ligase